MSGPVRPYPPAGPLSHDAQAVFDTIWRLLLYEATRWDLSGAGLVAVADTLRREVRRAVRRANAKGRVESA